jgi:hypothetical protein
MLYDIAVIVSVKLRIDEFEVASLWLGSGAEDSWEVDAICSLGPKEARRLSLDIAMTVAVQRESLEALGLTQLAGLPFNSGPFLLHPTLLPRVLCLELP